jgi:hypothetical protein
MSKIKSHKKGTQQLEFNFNALSTSHNIYNIKLGKPAKNVRKLERLDKPNRLVKFNKLGSSDTLTFSINQLQSFFKEQYGDTYIQVAGKEPVAVRESLDEINNIINIRR